MKLMGQAPASGALGQVDYQKLQIILFFQVIIVHMIPWSPGIRRHAYMVEYWPLPRPLAPRFASAPLP